MQREEVDEQVKNFIKENWLAIVLSMVTTIVVHGLLDLVISA